MAFTLKNIYKKRTFKEKVKINSIKSYFREE